MRKDPFVVKKHTGKKTVVVAAGPLGNASKGVSLVWADTTYYQVDKAGDYVQEAGG